MRSRFRYLAILVLLLFAANALAADEWVSVRSKNFQLVGNAKESDIRSVAIKLEQFRQVFSHLFPKIKLADSVETNVIVFKDKKSYEPFLPKRSDGRPDKGIAGYFLGDREANYITLSTEGDKKDTFEIIFHEYVHYLLNNNFKRSEIPPWLNEGLAEYYSTFEIEDDQKVMLGNLRNDHLYFLSSSELIPLRKFFEIDNYSLHKDGGHSRSIFYAQAWALVHYFAVKNESNRLSKFVELSAGNPDPESAFKEAFGLDYNEMESVLRQYTKQKKFTRLVASFKEKLLFDSNLQTGALTESEAFGFQGDLFYRMQEFELAEYYLARALENDPDQVRANTSMGLFKLRLKKRDEARPFLERAVAKGNSNYFAQYSYAYLLSREGVDGKGLVHSYTKENAGLMRSALKKSISLNPEFIESYILYAFINGVTNQDLDTAVAFLKKALAIQPGNEYASLNLAQIYARQQKFEESKAIAEAIMKSTASDDLREHATKVLGMAKNRESYQNLKRERMERFEKGADLDGNGVKKRRRLTDEEVEQIRAELFMSQLNGETIQAGEAESRSLGYFESTVCRGNDITYRFKTVDGNVITLKSDGFQGLELLAIVHLPEGEVFGCGFKSSLTRAVVNFKSGKSNTYVLTAITFVPSNFRIKSTEEISRDKKIIFISNPETGAQTAFEDKDISEVAPLPSR